MAGPVERSEALSELRAFQEDFRRYRRLIDAVWRRSPGGRGAAPTEEEAGAIDALREDLSRQYGRLRPALAEPHGGIPLLGSNVSGVAGEVFHVALRDPWDNPWLDGAFEGSTQTIAIAIGHFERMRDEDIITKTSIVYWWRRLAGRIRTIYRELKDWLTLLAKLRPPWT